ncbi:chemotaxis protein [Aliivibrio fischeri]|uniref:chemotaxis protein n=1 Tax=Aliivibrio fischeri TaxID=668 RepID=UPI0012D997F5|nr:chemotaxis protein [Aliivibrio fischeri]MCE7566966.1 chemotaxis protein [Aliivibrio fischeri]MUH97366.1 chemotaxis protein [Aliivibrio fischeri]MUI64979.1 chemotaxis protein [Aliivibrio fischeri]
MKMEGLILDDSDVIQETKNIHGTGESVQVGKIKLITTNPTATIEVKINEKLWNGGKGGEVLQACVGKRMNFEVEYKEMAFGNDQNKHVSINGFHLFALPVLNK